MSQAPGVGVLTTDRDLIVRTWNGWLASATGLAEDHVCGRPLGELAGGPSANWYRDIFADVVGTGTPRVLAPAFHRFLIPCPPREPSAHFDRMQQRVTVAPLRNGTDIVGLIVTIEDVTTRLDAERQLAARLEHSGSPDVALAAVGAEDWRVRREAVRALRQAATPADIEHLIQSLQRDHQNLGVLSGALQVLVAADFEVVQPLVALLHHADPNVRMHAALALGELRSDAAVAALIDVLDDADANVRFHAIEALGRIGAPEAVEPLAAIAASGDFFVAFAAIDALAATDDARVTGMLAGMLAQGAIRPAVVDALAVLGDEDSVAPLVDRLNAGDGDAGAIAAALERIHGRYEETYGAGAHIADLAGASLNASGVASLASALSRGLPPLRPLVVVLGWAGPAALPALVGALDHADVQASVSAALLRCGAGIVEPLLEKVEDGTRQERLAAAALLGRANDPRAMAPLIGLLRSPDTDLVITAAGSLASLGDERALDELLPLFGHELGAVRQAAVAAVNSIAAPQTAALVHGRLTDPDPRVRECAVRVAGYFAFDRCLAGILAAADDPREEVRRAAIEQLPLLDDPRALPRLVDALGHETPRNRAAAAHALRAVDDLSTTLPLLQALDDADSWVRYFAADSIARRRAIEAVPALVRVASNDPATHVRIAALYALGALDVPDAVDVAAEQVRSADADLVAAAVSALAGATDPRVDRLLEEAVRSANEACRLPAVRALASRPNRTAAEALAWAAGLDDPPGLRTLAIEGLARLASTTGETAELLDARAAAVSALLELAAGREAREPALAALAMLSPAAIAAVATGLESTRLSVRLAAVEALGRLRHPAASEALTRALDDVDAAVRGAAIAAFGRLGTRAVRETVVRMRGSDPDPDVRHRAAALCRRHGWDAGA